MQELKLRRQGFSGEQYQRFDPGGMPARCLDGVENTEPTGSSDADDLVIDARLRNQISKRYIKIERPQLLVIFAAAAAFAVPATIDGKCVDSRSRQLPGRIIPRLTVPIALVE